MYKYLSATAFDPLRSPSKLYPSNTYTKHYHKPIQLEGYSFAFADDVLQHPSRTPEKSTQNHEAVADVYKARTHFLVEMQKVPAAPVQDT